MKVLDIAMVMILIVIIILFLIVARDILIPMVMAVFIWYLINVMAVTIRRIKIFGVQIPSFVSYMVSITGMLALLFFVTVLITSNISQVVKAIPVYENNFQRVTAHLMQFLHIEKTLDLKSMFRDIDISHIATQTASALTGLVSKTGLIILYIFFLFLEQKFFPRKLRAMVHEQKKFQDMLEMIEMIDRDIRTYIGIKTLVSLLTAILGYLIMASVGLDFAGFWAFLLFLLNFIPTLGIGYSPNVNRILSPFSSEWYAILTVSSVFSLLWRNLKPALNSFSHKLANFPSEMFSIIKSTSSLLLLLPKRRET